MRFRRASLLIAAALLSTLAFAQETHDQWWAFSRLLGTWKGLGNGAPGTGSGVYSFERGLQGSILLRKNRSEYPATSTRAAFVHDDLMVLYAPADTLAHAIYFDNENHTINYSVAAAGTTVRFLSTPEEGQPQFRLSYSFSSPDTVVITFDIAPPGSNGQFSRYLSGIATRQRD